jgi:hypothetical protein
MMVQALVEEFNIHDTHNGYYMKIREIKHMVITTSLVDNSTGYSSSILTTAIIVFAKIHKPLHDFIYDVHRMWCNANVLNNDCKYIEYNT